MGVNLSAEKPADTFQLFDRKAAFRHLIKHSDIFCVVSVRRKEICKVLFMDAWGSMQEIKNKQTKK